MTTLGRLRAFALGLLLALAGAAPVAAQHQAPGAAAAPAVDAAATAPATTSSTVTALASAIVPGSVDRTSIDLTATYDVSAALTVGTGVLRVTTTITARNDSGAGIDNVKLNTIAERLGKMTITSASVDGHAVTPKLLDQTIKVPLGGVLPAGETVVVKIAYRATLKNSLSGSNWMFTRYGGTISLYRWIPWVSLLRPFDRPNHGDPFVTPSSPQVKVSLTLDKARILAAPVGGLPTTKRTTWSFTAHDVRDVSIVLASDFMITNRTVDGIAVRAYSRPGGVGGKKLADYAVTALDREAAQVGVAYPWSSLTVVETAGGYGLESPGLIWIPANTAKANLLYLVHHEVAHQWFYGLAGNDQQREPFADEAAADLLARTVLGSLRGTRCAKDDLDRKITGYSSACYYEVIYIQGSNVLNTIRKKMGSTTLFWNAMGDYLETYAQKLGGTKQLLDTLNAASPVDLTSYFAKRFPSRY